MKQFGILLMVLIGTSYMQPAYGQMNPCNVNPCDPPPGTDWIWFQCMRADTPCIAVCIPPIDPSTCVSYKIGNEYGGSHKSIFKVDISCPTGPDADSEYTICSLYKFDGLGTYTNWCSKFAIDSCGDPGGNDYDITLYSCAPPSTDIPPGQLLYVTICHACRKCTWTITFNDGSFCTIDPENVPNFCDSDQPFLNCCNK